MFNYLTRHSITVYTLAFLCMIITSAALYGSAKASTNAWTWILLAIFSLSNLLVLLVKK